MRSYSQFGEDQVVADLFPPGHVGTYVDVGAHHPVHGSNTYLFYLKGWRGITVEPTASNHALHLKHRPGDLAIRAACGNRNGHAKLYRCDETSVSTLVFAEANLRTTAGQRVEEEVVRLWTVDALVRRAFARHAATHPWTDPLYASGPDLLSIDVEGYEFAVLQGCPFGDGWRPRVLVIEACRPCTYDPCFEEWEGLLTDHAYVFHSQMGVNRIYRREEDLR